ncbi:muscle-specific protein 20-like [Actinia tenebrosa]|uniref:Muscle-specific protein 20-like n=1 Tax=Actinia tenebrosa TaxID=6105 RepID=A0A6P8HKG7_ACTTE|nr:muscle-specific protein 20-like [Actinia tenebrosa]
MANRSESFGLDREIQMKINSKYDEEKEKEARQWIECVMDERVFEDKTGPDGVHDILRDGKVLCRLANALGGNIKINAQSMPFKQMENISKFLKFCEETLGVAKYDLFQTVDLYEKRNMWNVICCITAVGRRAFAMGMEVPPLGPKESKKNPRRFTEEQLNEGKSHISLQMGVGSSAGATQAGHHFGRARQIVNNYK